MDYNRFKYEAAQRAKESRRKATTTGIKEMKYRPKIGVGDFDTKTRQVARFLNEGHKVKITIMFRGREMSHPELGKRILDQVAETVGAIAKVEAAPKLDGRNMVMVLAPDRRGQARKPSPNGADAGSARSAGRPDSAGLLPEAGLPPEDSPGQPDRVDPGDGTTAEEQRAAAPAAAGARRGSEERTGGAAPIR
jgi:translation initiation factor IF-3